MLNEPKRKAANGERGRPIERAIKLDATPKEVARSLFSAVKRPDPSKRQGKIRETSEVSNGQT